MTTPDSYRIVVQGQLSQDWADWFEGLAVTYDAKGDTVLTGQLEDQASLYGILNKVRDRGLTLVEVKRVEPKREDQEQNPSVQVNAESARRGLHWTEDSLTQTITDEFMHERRRLAREYCLVILKAGSRRNQPEAERIIWEHGRRNYALVEDGVLAIVCPVSDEGHVSGVYIFNAKPEEVTEIMEQDPGVTSQVFSYEVHACRGLPGQCLPK